MSDPYYGGGLGRPGTRIEQTRGKESETTRYVVQALIGTAAAQVALTVVVLSCVLIGWWTLPILFGVIGALVGLLFLLFGRPFYGSPLFYITGNLWAVGLGVGLVEGIWWRGWYDTLSRAVHSFVEPFEALKWWAYILAGVVFFAVWILSKKLSAAISLAGLAVVGVAIYGFIGAWEYTRWLLFLYGWPVVGFALLLSYIMAQQMLRPTVEWTVNPLTLAEVQEAGGWLALEFPALLKRPEERETPPGRTVRLEITNGHNIEIAPKLPDDDEHRQFYLAVANGASFSHRTAKKYQVHADYKNTIHPIFEDRGWIEPDGQGWTLTEAGMVGVAGLVPTENSLPDSQTDT